MNPASGFGTISAANLNNLNQENATYPKNPISHDSWGTSLYKILSLPLFTFLTAALIVFLIR